MAAVVTKPGQGHVQLKKTAGVSSPAIGTQTFVPMLGVQPRNPRNVARPDQVNKAGSIINAILGMKTPSCTWSAAAKASWWTAAFLNSLIGGSAAYLDSALDSDEYAVGMYEPIEATTRVYDGVRWTALSVSYNAAGGPIVLQAAGPGVYGDSEKPSPTSFSTPSVDPGQDLNTSDVTITGGATLVRSANFTLLRGNALQMFSNTTLYGTQVSSGKVGGILSFEQSPIGVLPTTSFVMQIGTVTFTFVIDQDDLVLDFTTSFGNRVLAYTLTNLATGAYPFTIT